MKEIKIGHTNKTFVDGNKFIIKKNKNGFNHKIDYSVLAEFDFVPKVISNTEDEIIFEYIEGEMVKNPSYEDIKQIARHVRTLHKSDVIFPKNNFRQRYKQYLITAHEKGIKMPEVETNWLKMNKVVTKMNRINPCHNDLWWQNFIKDKNGKIWIVDWEYATMGDKHFDLAFFIESCYLNKDQEEVFLKEYNSHDDYQAYIVEWMNSYKLFVNWLTLTWANAQEKEPFPLKIIRDRINELLKKK